MHADHTTNDIPYGYCQCGCGRLTSIARQTHTQFGHVKGQPVRFITGHHTRLNSANSLTTRFWEKVKKRRPLDCWEWQGAFHERGYGRMIKVKRLVYAHRLSWEIHFGPIPDGLWVLHKCDNPACVNPAHLFLGTDADNVADMIDKGRNSRPPTRRGSAHPLAKVTEQDVCAIRQLDEQGLSSVEIARQYGLSHSTVRRIITRKTWTHVLSSP